jgi:transketolase
MDYSKISKEIRRKILEIIYKSQSAHIGSSLSCVDILTVIYFKVLKTDSKNPLAEQRDRFILSKGHAVAGLYTILAKRGFFPEKVLETYCNNGTKLAGHSTRGAVSGIEISTGSLGHGLSIGAGIAFSAQNDRKDYRTFVLLSDGECQEGSTWEAALFASHHNLDNLIGIVDYNKLQALERINQVLKLEPFVKKWQDFGWEVKEIDGHNFSEIENSLSKIPFKRNKPSLIIAHTVKGKGISFLENKIISHYKHFTEEEYKKALDELKE